MDNLSAAFYCTQFQRVTDFLQHMKQRSPQGVEESTELSSSPYIMSGPPSNYEQVSFLYIYHKGLEDDGVQIMSVKFLIEREQDDVDSISLVFEIRIQFDISYLK